MGSIFTKYEIETLLGKLPGVGTDPHKIVGRPYQFECAHDSHRHLLYGTVQAIEISDEGGLDLYVSSPSSRFWGGHLVCIKFNSGKWKAHVEFKPFPIVGSIAVVGIQSYEGKFKLL